VFVLRLQVVNAFSVQTDVEMKGKVITRICNMTDLHELLNKSLAGNFYCVCLLTVALTAGTLCRISCKVNTYCTCTIGECTLCPKKMRLA